MQLLSDVLFLTFYRLREDTLKMELDERLRWFEARVTSSLKPRAEELKHLFSNEESRLIKFQSIVYL